MKRDSYDDLIDAARSRDNRPMIVFVSATFSLVLLWLIWGGAVSGFSYWAGASRLDMQTVPVEAATAGAWGDSFGGLNALFGGLGFGAIISTLLLQYQSLQEQKREQHVLRFEENFFRLLELMRSLRCELTYEQTERFAHVATRYVRPGERRGHSAIEAAFRELNYWSFKRRDGGPATKALLAGIYESYIQNRFEHCFAPYFRVIYIILFRIKHDKILTPDEKANYGNILRAQLTSFEIGLLGFNATSNYSKDLQVLLEEFRMLKYFPMKRRRVFGTVFSKNIYAART